jgi:hypothetical protein
LGGNVTPADPIVDNVPSPPYDNDLTTINYVALDSITVAIGDVIMFGGHYWRVLDIDNPHALIISDEIITHMAYHNAGTDITWEGSSVRRFLNREFLNRFDADERDWIRETYVINNDNPWYGTPGGANTMDKVFLLSIDEVLQYFGDSGMVAEGINPDVRGGVTYPELGITLGGIRDEFVIERIARRPDGTDGFWWLRSPGRTPNLEINSTAFAANVTNGGCIVIHGSWVTYYVGDEKGNGIRPAMWLHMNSPAFNNVY